MLFSAVQRNLILVPLVFLIGVWVGQNVLIGQQTEVQGNYKKKEIGSEEQRRFHVEDIVKTEDTNRNHFGNNSATAQKNFSDAADKQEAEDLPRQLLSNLASDLDLSWKNSESEPTLEFYDMLAPPPSENSSESYSYLIDFAQQSTAIEPSPQSIEEDITRSFEEAGVSPKEISSRVENVMEMFLQEDQEPAENYPSISAQ